MSASKNQEPHEGWTLIGESFARAGVKYIFGVPGESISPVQYAAHKASIEVVTARHEQAAAFMAEAYARITGNPGIVLVTFGPGFTNTISAMVNAQLTNAPVVLIAGAHGAKSPERLGLQDMHQEPIIRSVVKKSLVCRKAERIPEYIDMALRYATGGCPGPVFLELPIDVLTAPVDMDRVTWTGADITSRPVDAHDAEKLVEMIESSKKPIIIAGSGAYYSGAGDELTAFVDQVGIPAFTLKMGRGIISDTHPLCFGTSVPTTPGCAATAVTGSDLVILLGTRLCMYTANGAFFNKDAKVVQVDIEAEEIGRNKVIDLPIIADARALLTECKAVVSQRGIGDDLKARFGDWVKTLNVTHREQKEIAEKELVFDDVPINPGVLVREVDAFMDRDDDIIISDGGDAYSWVIATRTCRREMNVLDTGLFGCLGVGLPYGLAAKLAQPDRRVIVYTGDGALGFNFMEFETSLRKKLPIVVVIDNNRKWGMTSNSMMDEFGEYVPGTVEIGSVPYHEVVEALGGKGFLVEKAEDIRPTLEKAFACGVSACVNVMTDPEVIGPGSKAMAMMKHI
ncbi:MAG: thiamine pyrophosphate-binding protein [Deltaproteobacteria bacterium]|nr:thiamine pyrophosphate-binding protein [Candidatus Zymogenaceae bacterium]